ncbi:MAG: energy-coupled thiamine transporter ThiT [Oscillospiraceae bacterium]|nr:energy-coupled thiamine transporter ThiT [Oscillospiraceae bacterium]
METKKSKFTTVMLVEGAVMIALAAVLSLIKIYKLPWGGSITLLSMLPICMFSIKHGAAKGLIISVLYSCVQLLLDLSEVMSWGLTAGILIACFALDYILAYSVLGVAGMFNSKGIGGWIAGTVIAMLLRLLMHFLSGALIWKSVGEIWNLNIGNQYLYSLLYNGSYMVPEIVFTVIASVIMYRVPQLQKLIRPTAER